MKILINVTRFIIEFIDVKKRIGRGFNFEVSNLKLQTNEIIGLARNNGAGKTTILRLLLDLLRPEYGHIISFFKKVSKSDKWKSITESILDDWFLAPSLKSLEYFELLGQLKNVSNSIFSSQFKLFFGFLCEEIFNSSKYIREFSKGNRQKVEIVGALIGHPKVLVFDEPFVNLDLTAQYQLMLLPTQLPVLSNKIVPPLIMT